MKIQSKIKMNISGRHYTVNNLSKYYDMTINEIISDIGINNIKTSFCYSRLNKLFRGGWRLCTSCVILIYTDLVYCPFCSTKMRTRTKSKGNNKNV